MSSISKIACCQNWQLSSVAKIGERCRLPKLANFEETKVAKIGKYHQLPKLANFEETKVAKIDNFEETNVAKIGKYHQLPTLANVVGCQNWQILKTSKLPKWEFEYTWLECVSES